MQITYFFRKPREGAFSIENLFNSILVQLQKAFAVESHNMSYQSTGLINRILLLREAAKWQGELNHITGDINFIALALPKDKTVLTVHDVESLERGSGFKNYLLNLFWLVLPIKAVGKVTVISEHTKSKLLQKVKLDPNKIVVIPNPVADIYQYKPKEFQKVKPNLLQIGTKMNKNLENLIPALEGIACILTIVGKLSTLQMEMLHSFKVEYVNKVGLSNQELLMEYYAADIVTFVSLFEGFGLPIIEANAVGRAVITSNRGAMAEVAADAALLVDPNSVEAIRKGIQELIEDDLIRDNLIQKGLANVERYRPAVIAARYLDLYKNMLHES